jgi:hypothetical protein
LCHCLHILWYKLASAAFMISIVRFVLARGRLFRYISEWNRMIRTCSTLIVKARCIIPPMKSLHRVKIAYWGVVSKVLQFPLIILISGAKCLLHKLESGPNDYEAPLIPRQLLLSWFSQRQVLRRFFMPDCTEIHNP